VAGNPGMVAQQTVVPPVLQMMEALPGGFPDKHHNFFSQTWGLVAAAVVVSGFPNKLYHNLFQTSGLVVVAAAVVIVNHLGKARVVRRWVVQRVLDLDYSTAVSDCDDDDHGIHPPFSDAYCLDNNRYDCVSDP